jgi:hypothetical protein
VNFSVPVGTQVDSYPGDSYDNDREFVPRPEEVAANHYEVQDNEEPVAWKDRLRLVEESAKAIDYMNDHQFSFVWRPCSSNTYGKKMISMLVVLFFEFIYVLSISLTAAVNRLLHSQCVALRLSLQAPAHS